ncbi:hypothetical protein EDB84DRAFT_1505022 [Lactarius hengduanensis]|nr:hypothetical protein EDB84DRAFT_1505022 [Lactarius hengduanensis]
MWHGFSGVLIKASRFDVQDTSPELQHEFCALWNEIVLKGQDALLMAVGILRPIRNVYFDLHRNTDSAPTRFSPSTDNLDVILFELSSYPVCNVAGHIHDDSTSTTPTRSALHDAAAFAPASESLASPNAPSSSVPSPHHVDHTLTVIPPLDNDIYAPGFFHPAHHTPTENPHIPPTSQDPVTAHTSTTSTPLSTPEHPAPTLPPNSVASASTPGAVAIQNITGCRTSSDVLDVPSLPSPTPVLDNMLPTGP